MVHTGYDDDAFRDSLPFLLSVEFHSRRRTSKLGQGYFNFDQIVMYYGAEEIALDVYPRKRKRGFSVHNAERAHELDFSGFEIPEHCRIVDASAGVRIDKANSSGKPKDLVIHAPKDATLDVQKGGSYINRKAHLTEAWRRSSKMEKIRKLLDSDLHSVDEAEELVLNEALKLGFDEDDAHQIGMAVRECTVNAVVHGNRYNKNKKVHFEVDGSADSLIITIGDEGAGFSMDSLPDPTAPENLLRQSGRGLLLIRAFMDDFDLHLRQGGGTEVRLLKRLPQAQSSTNLKEAK